MPTRSKSKAVKKPYDERLRDEIRRISEAFDVADPLTLRALRIVALISMSDDADLFEMLGRISEDAFRLGRDGSVDAFSVGIVIDAICDKTKLRKIARACAPDHEKHLVDERSKKGLRAHVLAIARTAIEEWSAAPSDVVREECIRKLQRDLWTCAPTWPRVGTVGDEPVEHIEDIERNTASSRRWVETLVKDHAERAVDLRSRKEQSSALALVLLVRVGWKRAEARGVIRGALQVARSRARTAGKLSKK